MEPSILRTVSTTLVPFGPRIMLTTSLRFIPATETASSPSWRTFMMTSFSVSSPAFHAGPPTTTSVTFVYSPSVWRRAPMPSSLPAIWMSKFSLSTGAK